MPVVQTTLLPPIFRGNVSTFFENLDSTGEEYQKLIGFRADFFAAQQSSDHFVADAALRLYKRDEQGDTVEIYTEHLTPGNLEAFKDLLLAYHMRGTDVPHASAFTKLLPWNDHRFSTSLWNTYHSVHIMRDFTLVTREFLPLYVQDQENEHLIRSSDVDLNDRKVFCTLVIPETTTAHETIEQATQYADIARDASQLYRHLMSGDFFEDEMMKTEIDFANLEKLEA